MLQATEAAEAAAAAAEAAEDARFAAEMKRYKAAMNEALFQWMVFAGAMKRMPDSDILRMFPRYDTRDPVSDPILFACALHVSHMHVHFVDICGRRVCVRLQVCVALL